MKNSQKGFSTLLGLLLLIVLAGGGLFLYSEKVSKEIPEVNSVSTTTQKEEATTSIKKETSVACTMDAKQCPNGTYVGRTGPNCEFVCPVTLLNEDASGYIKSAYSKNGKNYIDIDYITFRHEQRDMPWGAIINDNPKIRTFEVSPSATIKLKNDFVNGVLTSGDYIVIFDKLKNIISNPQDIRTSNPWDIIVKDNVIISITENFRS